MLSSHPLVVEANLDKGTFYHDEPIKVNLSLANRSSKSVRKVRITVRQFAAICLFANAEYKCTVAEMESSEGFPLGTGSSLQRTFEITPSMKNNRDKKGLAVDGQIKHEDTCLASSTIIPNGVEETRELRENLGIVVHYSVKVRLVVAFGSDVTLEMPFTLTHPKPKEKVVCQKVTFPPRASLSSASDIKKGEEKKEELEKKDENLPKSPGAASGGQAFDTVSVHDIIDHNLISFDTDDDENEDFVFEEFVRLRVTGMEEQNETDA